MVQMHIRLGTRLIQSNYLHVFIPPIHYYYPIMIYLIPILSTCIYMYLSHLQTNPTYANPTYRSHLQTYLTNLIYLLNPTYTHPTYLPNPHYLNPATPVHYVLVGIKYTPLPSTHPVQCQTHLYQKVTARL